MLDSTKTKMMKKQLEKKDERIAELTERNAALEKEKAELIERSAKERERVEEAAKVATDTITEYREKILEVERVHQKFLRLMEETKNINETYRERFEELIQAVQKAEGGD